MKALVYTGPESISFQDVPDPEAVLDEVIINVGSAYAGRICMPISAMMIADRRR